MKTRIELTETELKEVLTIGMLAKGYHVDGDWSLIVSEDRGPLDLGPATLSIRAYAYIEPAAAIAERYEAKAEEIAAEIKTREAKP